MDLNKGTVVLQYDVRLQKGYDCGGAYIKFLMPQVRVDINLTSQPVPLGR